MRNAKTGALHLKLMSLLLITGFVAAACGTDPLLGKWRASREFVRGEWRTIPTNVLVDLTNEGKFIVTTSDGWKRAGTYGPDNSVNPRKFVASDETKRTIRGIYKVEGDKLTVRAGELLESEMPKGFDPLDENEAVFLVEFERIRE